MRTGAEFGFGLNPRATRIGGSKLEDQVVRGTAYFGFGDNTAIGGSAAVGFHIRGVMKDPSVTLDDFSLIREGKITMA